MSVEVTEMNVDLEKGMGRIGNVVCEHDRKKALLIPALHMMQEENGYLPGEELQKLSKKLGIPLAEIYSVASFYQQFHFSPRGKKIVRVCMGTACHVRGASVLLEGLKEKFSIDVGETTQDLAMTLETVGCVGCCGLAPVATVNEDIIGEVDRAKLQDLISSIEDEE